jgi:hypothetical protein
MPDHPSPSGAVQPLQRVQAGDRVLMRKKHPCGSFHWGVTRVGADIGLRCEGCGRRLMLTRDAFYRGARRLISPDPGGEADLWNPDSPAGTTDVTPG